MESTTFDALIATSLLAFIPLFLSYSPASKSTKLWTTIYLSLFAAYIYIPEAFKSHFASARGHVYENPYQSALIALTIVLALKYLQQKLRFARVNALKWKHGFTSDPASYENMTVEQAQEVESNMAEWEFPRLWQWGWLSDFFRTSTDPGVSRAITASGHFINEDKRVEHQRMQATVHMMTGFVAWKVKSPMHSLVIARINEHHHRYGIKINSDDVLYLIIHFGLAPVPWINKFGYRKVEPFEEQGIWTLWRENAVRMGVKYVPKTLAQAKEWRRNFEKTFRWREDANELMATAMLDQVLYAVPTVLKSTVAQVFASIVDWDIVYYCQLEKLKPNWLIREIVHDIFRVCGWLVLHFGLPRLNAYQRSPAAPNEDGKVNFGHTPYDTMPYWQEASLWNLWGPRALISRLRGLPMPSPEFESNGVALESMGAPHPHPVTQSAIERKVRENAIRLEDAPYGYRSSVGFQATRLIPPVDGPTYGSEENTFPEGTGLTPASPERFTRAYERRGGVFAKVEGIEKPEDVAVGEMRRDSTQGN